MLQSVLAVFENATFRAPDMQTLEAKIRGIGRIKFPPDLKIAVIGDSGKGKSSSINSLIHSSGGDIASAGDSAHSHTLVVQKLCAAKESDDVHRAEVHFMEPKDAAKLVRDIPMLASNYFEQLDKKMTGEWTPQEEDDLRDMKTVYDTGIEVLTALFREQKQFSSILASNTTIARVHDEQAKRKLCEELESMAVEMVKALYCEVEERYIVKVEAKTANDLRKKLRPYAGRSQNDGSKWPIVDYVR